MEKKVKPLFPTDTNRPISRDELLTAGKNWLAPLFGEYMQTQLPTRKYSRGWQKRAVVANGKRYESVQAASVDLGITASAVCHRAKVGGMGVEYA